MPVTDGMDLTDLIALEHLYAIINGLLLVLKARILLILLPF